MEGKGMMGSEETEALHADLEQKNIAEEFLLHLLRLTLAHPNAMTRKAVSGLLVMAAEERERQGDYVASMMLAEWSVIVAQELKATPDE